MAANCRLSRLAGCAAPCGDGGMDLTAAFRRWRAGWPRLARRESPPAYTGAGRLARLALDLAVVRRALADAGTAFAVLAAVAAGLAAHVLCWELDLHGWRRDAVLVLPAVLVAPWFATGRRRHLAAVLAARAARPATAVTDHARGPRHSGRAHVGRVARRVRWLTRQDVRRAVLSVMGSPLRTALRRHHRADPASAGSTSPSAAPAWRRWRPWRSRASAPPPPRPRAPR